MTPPDAPEQTAMDVRAEQVGRSPSRVRWGTGREASKDRLAAIPGAIARGADILARIKGADGDMSALADLMAEAIWMDREARQVEAVGRSGTVVLCMEALQAAYAMDASRDAYLRAKGSNET